MGKCEAGTDYQMGSPHALALSVLFVKIRLNLCKGLDQVGWGRGGGTDFNGFVRIAQMGAMMPWSNLCHSLKSV